MAHMRPIQLGVHLLETITRGMYSEPFHCVREYIQNAFDSIRAGRREGLLRSGDGCVDVIVDNDAKALRIRDNGTGLSPEEAVVRLVDIGYSDKAATADATSTNAGFRGIGRMAGISYCRRLVFETSDGGGRTCEVAFDAQAINELTRPGQAPITIEEAIDRNCTVNEQPSESGERFLQVSLEKVDPALLDTTALTSYLEQTAPVRQDPTTWKFENKILSFADSAGHPESLDTVSIRICDPEGAILHAIYRPFKGSFETKNAQGRSPRSVDVKDVVMLPKEGDYQGWWGWLALHTRRGALADVPFKGLRVRMHNIAIGDHSLLQPLWARPDLALWCFGEIHIVDPALVPNSQRDNFESSPELTRLWEQLRDEMQWIQREIRRESEERNTSIDIVTQRANKTARTVKHKLDEGLTSDDQKTLLIDQINKETSRLENALQKNNRTEAERSQLGQNIRSLKSLKNEIDDLPSADDDATMFYLDERTREAVSTVLAVVQEELSDDKRFAAIKRRVFAALRLAAAAD